MMNEYRNALNDLPFDPDQKEKTIRMLKDYAHAKAKQPVRPMWQHSGRVAVAVACAVVVLLGAVVLWRGQDSAVPPVKPDEGAVVPPPTTTAPTTATVPLTRPTGNLEGIGGDIWYECWDWNRYGTADMVISFLEMDKLITKEEYTEWYEQFDSGYEDFDPDSDKRLFEECSVYTFVRDFDVPREFLETHNKQYEENVGYPIYSNEAMDLIYGNDEKAFIAYFASPTAIPVNNRIYSVRWLQNHSVEEWTQVGITKEDIESRLENWTNYFGYSAEDDYFADLTKKVTEFCN